jgi:hypothetical protein
LDSLTDNYTTLILRSKYNVALEFPQFYPQTSDFAPFIIHNFMKVSKI